MVKRLNGNGNLTSRIVRLEASVESLKGELDTVARGVTDIADRLEREFQRSREAAKPNWGAYIGIGTLMVMLFFGIGSAAYVPVWITTSNINAKAQSAFDRSQQNAEKLTALGTKFTEVETQFRSTDELRNVQFAEIQRQLSMHQNVLHEMNKFYPAAPNVPYYSPHVSSDHKGAEFDQ